MNSLDNAPEQVRAVAEALLANCAQAADELVEQYKLTDEEEHETRGFWAERVHVMYRMRGVEANAEPAWTLWDNYEREGGLIYYPLREQGRRWYTMESYGEHETHQTFEQCMSAASIWFTG